MKESLPNLEPHQLRWIFENAGEHYQKEVERLETEIVRHERFITDPIVRARLGETPTRRERIAECEQWIVRYREVVTFCRLASEAAADRSAKDFAQAFAGQFNFGKKAKAKPAAPANAQPPAQTINLKEFAEALAAEAKPAPGDKL